MTLTFIVLHFYFITIFFSVTRLILCSSIVNFCHIFQGISSGSSCTRNAVIILLLLLSVLHSTCSSPGTAFPFLSYVPSSHAAHLIRALVHLYLHIYVPSRPPSQLGRPHTAFVSRKNFLIQQTDVCAILTKVLSSWMITAS